MMTIRKPTTLKSGDTVGLVSVSSPVKEEVVQKSVNYLTRLGFTVALAEHIYAADGYMAGSPQDRVRDLHAFFADERVKAIFCSYGGTSANQLLPLIDYGLVRSNPKIFVGMSDPSVLSLALYAKAGIVAFHGPTGYNFAKKMSPYTEKYLLKALTTSEPVGLIDESSRWSMIRGGVAGGELMGGNLSLLQSLMGTPYEPDWDGKILFWEDIGLQYHTIDLILTQFQAAGVFNKITGMIVGKLVDCKEDEYESSETLEDMLSRLFDSYDFPIVCNVDLGHTDDKITIPLGVKGIMSLNAEVKQITLLESGVMAP